MEEKGLSAKWTKKLLEKDGKYHTSYPRVDIVAVRMLHEEDAHDPERVKYVALIVLTHVNTLSRTLVIIKHIEKFANTSGTLCNSLNCNGWISLQYQ